MVLCLDIGGTFLRIADVYGEKIKDKKVTKTPSSKKRILEKIVELIREHKGRHIVCVSVAGFVKNGEVIASPNTDLEGINLKKYIERELGVRVYIQNDARCAAMAENLYGLGQKYKNFVYLTIGTGIGGAIFVDNDLYVGKSFAGEFGHMIIKDEEFEKSSSGKAFNKMMRKFGKKGAYKIIRNNLSEGILNIIYALDPEAVVIGGGYGSEEIDIKKLKNEIIKRDIIKRDIKILKNSFDGNDSLIGASILSKINF